VKTPHCGVYCRRLADGRAYHYHSGKKRGHRSYGSSPLAHDRRDPLMLDTPREWGGPMSRGAVRAAERAALRHFEFWE